MKRKLLFPVIYCMLCICACMKPDETELIMKEITVRNQPPILRPEITNIIDSFVMCNKGKRFYDVWIDKVNPDSFVLQLSARNHRGFFQYQAQMFNHRPIMRHVTPLGTYVNIFSGTEKYICPVKDIPLDSLGNQPYDIYAQNAYWRVYCSTLRGLHIENIVHDYDDVYPYAPQFPNNYKGLP